MISAWLPGRRCGRGMPSIRNDPATAEDPSTGSGSTYGNRNGVSTKPATSSDRHPHCPGRPKAGSCGRAEHGGAVFHDGATSDEADAGDDAINNAGRTLGMVNQQRLRRLHEAARRKCNERKGPQARAALRLFAIPADRQGEDIGGSEGSKMRQYAVGVQRASSLVRSKSG